MSTTSVQVNIKAAILFKNHTWRERIFYNLAVGYNPLDMDYSDEDLVEAVHAEIKFTTDSNIQGVHILESWPAGGDETPHTVACTILIAVCYPGGTWQPVTYENFPVPSQQPEGELPTNQEVLDAVSLKAYSEREPTPMALGLIAFRRIGGPAGINFAAAAQQVLDKNSALYKRLSAL